MLAKKQTPNEIIAGLPIWGIAAAVILLVLPAVEQAWPDGTPIGLPIRGYGVMVLLGLLSGIGITIHRGRQLKIAPDTIIGLGFWMMLGGVLGARTFYVVQKWSEFDGASILEKLVAIVKLTEGGLVIYGGVIGGIVAGMLYCRRHQLKILATGDLIAPGFLIGLSLGRIGCLLHGCCFGGVCTAELPTITFPQGSAPYMAQAASGRLMGIDLEESQWPTRIAAVESGSVAAAKGLVAEEQVQSISLRPVASAEAMDPAAPLQIGAEVELSDRRVAFWPLDLPARSLPVHPSQIYASLNALLLCLLVWHLQPFPRHDGIAFFVAIFLYACSRFILEWVRSDEAGQLGTALTISQWVSIASGVVAIAALVAIFRTKPGRYWDWG